MKEKINEQLEADDLELSKYHIVDNYFDLQALMAELAEMFPGLRQDQVIRVEWSKNIVKDWFAQCTRLQEQGGHFQIHVNRILSSPDVDREVIKYLLFHELLHANGYWKHDLEKFRKREWQYPNSAELDGFMEELFIRYDMAGIWDKAIATENYAEDGSVLNSSPIAESIIPDKDQKVSESKATDKEETPEEDTEASKDEHFNPHAKGVIQGYKYCRNCGHKVPESTKFCDKCGERMDY